MLRHYIIALGGATGSLEAILEFFDHTPLTNASYVILQHLPKGYKSHLTSILSKHSSVEVVEAHDGNSIEIDKVFHAPANSSISLSNGKFRLTDRKEDLHRPIDTFFNALALDEHHKNKIAVVLSGSGNDGSEGARSIKKAGGKIIVQSLDTCQFTELPGHVLKLVQADFIATPQDIPSIIRTIADHPQSSAISPLSPPKR